MKNCMVYINKEIHEPEKDYVGFSVQADSIVDAVNSGAKMIAVVGDYGSGKSSLVELVSQKKQFGEPILVNMWDSEQNSQTKTGDDKLTFLEKSLLYQIALNGGKKHLARHVNKRLNTNSGLISFTFANKKFLIPLFISILFFALV